MKRNFFWVLLGAVLFFPGAGVAQTSPPPPPLPAPSVGGPPLPSTNAPSSVSPPLVPPVSVPPEEQALFNQAKLLFDQGNDEALLPLLEQFALKFPNSSLLSTVYFEMGLVYARRGDSKRAIEIYKTVLDKFPNFDRISEARSQLSDVYFSVGDLEAALSFWKEIPGEEAAKIFVYDRAAKAYAERKDDDSALHVLLLKKGLLIDPAMNDAVRQEIGKIVRERLQERELLALAKQFPNDFPGDEALIRLMSFYDGKKDYYREEREIKRFLSLFQNHPFDAEARNLLERIHDKIKMNRYLIGVLLPLSGRLAPFGLSALNGAQLALRQFKETAPGASVALVVRDMDEEPSRARAAVEGWLTDYRPVALVGPLLSKEVDRIAPIVEKEDLTLITPGATASHLASLGKAVLRNAMTTPVQCRALAEYAVTQLHLKRFAILFPKESYGMEWVKCFSEETAKLGGEIVDAEPYPLNETDFTPSIRRLKEADLKKNGAAAVVGSKRGKREVLYAPGFDALFLPGDARNVGLIIPQLVFHNIQGVVFLGAGGWNTPEFLKIVGPYAEGAVLVDGFFSESPDPPVRKFVRQYRAEFQQEPDIFAAQAFDAVRLILTTLEGGATNPREVRQGLLNLKNVQGASGLISEVREGEMVKKPFLIQVQKGKFVQINPESAPPAPPPPPEKAKTP